MRHLTKSQKYNLTVHSVSPQSNFFPIRNVEIRHSNIREMVQTNCNNLLRQCNIRHEPDKSASAHEYRSYLPIYKVSNGAVPRVTRSRVNTHRRRSGTCLTTCPLVNSWPNGLCFQVTRGRTAMWWRYRRNGIRPIGRTCTIWPRSYRASATMSIGINILLSFDLIFFSLKIL